MEPKASYTLIGLFLILTSMGALGFILWVNQVGFTKGKTYEIYFAGSIAGLRKNDVVSYNGVPIGKITDITIPEGQIDQVRVRTVIEQPDLIRESSYATLEMKGITGYLSLQIRGSSHNSPPLIRHGTTPYPIIRSRLSKLQQIMDKTPKIMLKAIEVVERLLPFLSRENAQNFEGLLKNLHLMSDQMVDSSKDTALIPTIHASFIQLQKTLREFEILVTSKHLQGTVKETHNMVTELRGLTETMHNIATALERNPRRYLMNEPLPQQPTIGINNAP